jgi:hypothetical protein
VVTALTAVGKTISLDFGVDPTKEAGQKDFLPCIAQMVDGFAKADPPTMKKLPVEVDVPEYLVKQGQAEGAPATAEAVGDLALIAFYYLLRVGEYTIKGARNESKQTVQFKLEDVTFFKRNSAGQLRQVARNATDDTIATADGATLKLDNQKNGHKGVCIHHEANGDSIFCPVRALGRRYCHIRRHAMGNYKTYLSAYWDEGTRRQDVTDKDMSRALKVAATVLDYPHTRGVPVARVDTHSLRGGGANALSLQGYSDTQIQKLGRWRGETFKEYIREELASFSVGMSTAMKKCLGYVNVSGGVFHMLPEDSLLPTQ